MKFKLFTHGDKETVEAQVNAWLGSLPKQPTIHKSEFDMPNVTLEGTGTGGKKISKKVPVCAISVWYD